MLLWGRRKMCVNLLEKTEGQLNFDIQISFLTVKEEATEKKK